MNKEQFLTLAEQGYNKIPLVREVLADLDTPLSAFMKLAAQPTSYLFESVQGGEKWGRTRSSGCLAKNVLKSGDSKSAFASMIRLLKQSNPRTRSSG